MHVGLGGVYSITRASDWTCNASHEVFLWGRVAPPLKISYCKKKEIVARRNGVLINIDRDDFDLYRVDSVFKENSSNSDDVRDDSNSATIWC